MNKFLVTLSFLLVSVIVESQKYQPSWGSLDKRPVPQWFEDAKFGVFISLGIFSVPAWAPTSDSVNVYDKYSEWYWNKLVNTKSKVNGYFREFHDKTYGPDFKYQDFAPMYRAELFDADQWAEIIRSSGAKYCVMMAKHHDGFALWPSEHSWNWNSVDIGPHRDFCAEVTKAVRSVGIRMGLYYSLYEWYNPVYLKDPQRYVDSYMIPQMKDLVTRYKPEIIWSDGEWDKNSKEWKSEEFLAWLYNESPVRETVVVNDRWGNETRSIHGGFYTTEYGLVHDKKGISNPEPHPWEEVRGIGTSFGLNRAEDLANYSSAEELIRLLVRTVAAGGNLLLDIGIAADGTIPVIMQQRLSEIGDWLEINGDAIYETRPFVNGMDAESINPAAGKSVFFTRKNKDVYMICLDWPVREIVLSNISTTVAPRATLLGTDKKVILKAKGNKVSVIPPVLTPDEHQLAYVFRISGLIKKE